MTNAFSSLLIFISLIASVSTANAEPRRPYTTESSFRLNYVEGKKFDGPNGSYLDVDDDVGFGFSYLYNKTTHWALGGSFDWTSPSYTAYVKADDPANDDFSVRTKLDIFSLNFDAVYYFLDQPFTPFVMGSLGWTNIDSNLSNGPAYNYCWWDYWGGYYCTTYRPTKNESGLNYRLGIGARWDLNRDWAVKGTYLQSEVDIDVAGENPRYNLWLLDLVYKFY